MNTTTQFGLGMEEKRSRRDLISIWEPAYTRSNHVACQPQVDDAGLAGSLAPSAAWPFIWQAEMRTNVSAYK